MTESACLWKLAICSIQGGVECGIGDRGDRAQLRHLPSTLWTLKALRVMHMCMGAISQACLLLVAGILQCTAVIFVLQALLNTVQGAGDSSALLIHCEVRQWTLFSVHNRFVAKWAQYSSFFS